MVSVCYYELLKLFKSYSLSLTLNTAKKLVFDDKQFFLSGTSCTISHQACILLIFERVFTQAYV